MNALMNIGSGTEAYSIIDPPSPPPAIQPASQPSSQPTSRPAIQPASQSSDQIRRSYPPDDALKKEDLPARPPSDAVDRTYSPQGGSITACACAAAAAATCSRRASDHEGPSGPFPLRLPLITPGASMGVRHREFFGGWIIE